MTKQNNIFCINKLPIEDMGFIIDSLENNTIHIKLPEEDESCIALAAQLSSLIRAIHRWL